MPRHLFSGMLAIIATLAALNACAPSAPQTKPALSNHSGFTNPVNPIQLTTLPNTGTQPGVNAPPLVAKTIRVGLLLPITGRNADIGRAMQDAATVALYDKYASLSVQESTIRVELLPKDTGDTPEQAAAAATSALADGAVFLIGPVFADATEAVEPIARAKNVNILSFSNNTAHMGQGTYAFGFSPQDQTTRVIHYAIKQGKTRIAALVPNSPLGTTVLEAAKAALAAHGQSLAGEARYVPQGLGIDKAISQLIPDATAPGFDALLIPEGGAPLNTILLTLASHGVTSQNVQLLGTGIWDDAGLVRRVPLDGAWLASSPPSDTALFENRFRKTYNYLPPRIASLAYDAVSLTVTLATSGRSFDAATLTSDSGFSGPGNGIFRLRSNGKTERGLAVLQIDGATFKVIDSASVGFNGR